MNHAPEHKLNGSLPAKLSSVLLHSILHFHHNSRFESPSEDKFQLFSYILFLVKVQLYGLPASIIGHFFAAIFYFRNLSLTSLRTTKMRLFVSVILQVLLSALKELSESSLNKNSNLQENIARVVQKYSPDFSKDVLNNTYIRERFLRPPAQP